MSKQDIAMDVLAKFTGRTRAELKPELKLTADLGIDSPKALQVLAELEDTLHIEISDEEAAAMNTVADIANYAAKLK